MPSFRGDARDQRGDLATGLRSGSLGICVETLASFGHGPRHGPADRVGRVRDDGHGLVDAQPRRDALGEHDHDALPVVMQKVHAGFEVGVGHVGDVGVGGDARGPLTQCPREGHGDKRRAAGRNRDDVHVFGRRSTCQTLADGRVRQAEERDRRLGGENGNERWGLAKREGA